MNIFYNEGGVKMINKMSCPNGTMAYTIKSGDTFYSIAKSFGISLESLIATNPGIEAEELYIGQIICVPAICSYGTLAHLLKKGDTIYKLSLQYNVTVDKIVKANPGINPDNLTIGEVICLPLY